MKNIQFLPNSDRTTYKIEQDSILQSIYLDLISDEKLIIIQRDKKVTFLSLEIQSENELFAKLFCENLANETSNFYIQTKNKNFSTRNYCLDSWHLCNYSTTSLVCKHIKHSWN